LCWGGSWGLPDFLFQEVPPMAEQPIAYQLVRSRRNGKQIYYTLADDHVKTILGTAKEHLEE
jgi:hypothetical protein